ncbi:MAG TPA: hypothetical protein VJN02_07700 [Gammaproteobacteria bacterium]|nr:hypothetical protein [Gammaproteobacteria bacterium]
MKLKELSVIALGCLGFAMAAHANEVLLTANQPMKIAFRVAHKNQNNQPIFGELQSIDVSKNVTVPVSLDNYDRAGIIIVSAGGHELPPSANQFDEPKQCSMTTDKAKATGALEFTLSAHSISCRTYGGVFG